MAWETPAVISDHLETSPFKKTLCFSSFEKSAKYSSKFPLIPFCFHLKIIPSCQTLSNAFDISWNTPLTSYPLLNDL